MFEAEYEWIGEGGSRTRDANDIKDLTISGPTYLSTAARDSDASGDSDSESDEEDLRQGELPEGLWLMDTGSGHDLTTPAGAEGYTLEKIRKIIFSTANGRISTNTAISVLSTILRGPADPYVLPETPWVLSIGRRVMEMGYSFVWIANTPPWLVSPDGHRIDLEVHGNIPFLRVGDQAEQAMVAKSVPRITPVQVDPEEDEDEICAPAKVKQCPGCSNAKSALTAKSSIIVLDSDEEESDSEQSNTSEPEQEDSEASDMDAEECPADTEEGSVELCSRALPSPAGQNIVPREQASQ